MFYANQLRQQEIELGDNVGLRAPCHAATGNVQRIAIYLLQNSSLPRTEMRGKHQRIHRATPRSARVTSRVYRGAFLLGLGFFPPVRG